MSVIFRQLLDLRSSTYTYLLADPRTHEAVIIDPVFEQVRRDVALVRELGLTLLYTLDTHVHADHITGAWLLKRALGSQICIAQSSGARNYDIGIAPDERLRFGSHHLEARATPGHTNGCMTFVLDDRSMAFTGDALLIRGAGRTDFQGGDAHTLFRSIVGEIYTLPDHCLLYPAHDYRGLTCSSVAEEKAYNPRVALDRSERDFVGYMENLGLPHPKQIDVALPANLECGHIDLADELLEATWAPLRYTYAGTNEVDVDWVADHTHELHIIDVRDANEWSGVLGHIAGAKLIPLEQLRERAASLGQDKPIVTVCRSGARSAQAVAILEKAGFKRVANLAGGMIDWNNHRLPISTGA
jgi:glyoxylase-like metal-dependent hydrolase (beta-lactamase superfamily II)/rhodanese-related sulfurtransferase